MPPGLPRLHLRSGGPSPRAHPPPHTAESVGDYREPARIVGPFEGSGTDFFRERTPSRGSEADRVSTRAPQVRRHRPHRPHLRVVRRKSRGLMVRSESRRMVPLVIVTGIAVFAVVVGVLLEQVVLAQSAFKLARVREMLITEEQRHQNLLLEATRLEGSGRIERYAREVLGMVESKPQSTNYLIADVHLRDPLRSPARGKSRQLAVGQAAGGLISDRLGP